MLKRPFYFLSAVAAICLWLLLPTGCAPDGKQQVEEKGVIEKMTDQAAETAEKKITTPLDKARATQNLGNDRLEAMDKALQKQ